MDLSMCGTVTKGGSEALSPSLGVPSHLPAKGLGQTPARESEPANARSPHIPASHMGGRKGIRRENAHGPGTAPKLGFRWKIGEVAYRASRRLERFSAASVWGATRGTLSGFLQHPCSVDAAQRTRGLQEHAQGHTARGAGSHQAFHCRWSHS